MHDPLSLPSLPMPFYWWTPPVQWGVAGRSSLTMSAGPTSDLFVNPQGGPAVLNAPRLLGAVTGDFQFSARVTVDFAATFDAGVLLVWIDEGRWAKLCFEYSPLHQPMVVSVVTRGASDDANGFVVPTNTVWLRVARLGTALAFHASIDGHRWELIRHFPFDTNEGEQAYIGFVAQSPTGDGCTASFDDMRFLPQRLADLRDGG